jgi:hypothetical protein
MLVIGVYWSAWIFLGMCTIGFWAWEAKIGSGRFNDKIPYLAKVLKMNINNLTA